MGVAYAAPETFALSRLSAKRKLWNQTALLSGQSFTALGTAAADNGAAIGSAHAGTEAMGTLSADFAGLIRSFHDARSPYWDWNG